MAFSMTSITSKLKKVPPLGWLAVAAAGVGAWYFWNKNKTSTAADGGITADQSGLALSNLAGMPFESLNPDQGSTTDYQPVSGNTDLVSGTPTNTTGPGANTSAPALPTVDNTQMPGVPPTGTTPNYYSSQNRPGESQGAIEKEYEGCVANCIRAEHKGDKSFTAHCQQKCGIRHPMGAAMGVGGFDDWDMFDNLHNEFHADTSQWIQLMLGGIMTNHYENDVYSHAMGAGGQYPGNNLPQINVGKNVRVVRGVGQTAVPASNIDVHGQSTWPDPREHLGGAMGTGTIEGGGFNLDDWWTNQDG